MQERSASHYLFHLYHQLIIFVNGFTDNTVLSRGACFLSVRDVHDFVHEKAP